jgi:hypothetical protein
MKSRTIDQLSPTLKLGWFHPRIIESLKGLTRDQLDGRRKAGKYIQDEHWTRDYLGSIMWHFENLDHWVEGGVKC